jgi:hypothetical protein
LNSSSSNQPPISIPSHFTTTKSIHFPKYQTIIQTIHQPTIHQKNAPTTMGITTPKALFLV